MQTSFLHEEILVESIFKLILENGKVKNIWYKTINLQFKSGGILAIELDVVPLMQGTKFTQYKLVRKHDLTEAIWEIHFSEQTRVGDYRKVDFKRNLASFYKGAQSLSFVIYFSQISKVNLHF